MLSRSMNATRSRWENFFSSEEPSPGEVVDRNDILDKLTYAAANPVFKYSSAGVRGIQR